MALSFVLTNGDGATTNFAVPFQYLDISHVHVYVSGTEKSFTWINSSTIQVSPAPASGTLNVEIRRVTPRDAALVDYQNGSVLGESDLDRTAQQSLFISQEYFEQTENFFPAGHALDSHTDSTPAESTAKGALRIYDQDSKTRALVATDGGLLQGDTAETKGAKFLPVGTNGQTLEVDTGVTGKLAWKAPLRDTVTTKGDILVATAASTPARKAVGNEGGILICLPATSDGLSWQDGIMNGAPLIGGYLTAVASAGAVTIAVKTLAGADPSATSPVFAVFRNSIGTSGVVTLRKITAALSLTIPSGATLGTVASNHYRIHIGMLDNGGTVELFVWNGHDTVSGPVWYAESQLLATTSMGTGSDAAHTAYSTTGLAASPWRYTGYVEFNVATPGTWPSPYQLATATVLTPLPGQIVQARFVPTGAYAVGSTTAIPFDDTIPQITEGVEFMTLTIAALNQANLMQVSVQAQLAHNSASTALTMALFKNATANALAAAYWVANSAQPVPLHIQFWEKPNTTSVTTYRVRVGSDGGATTPYMNGTSSGRRMGGVANSYMQINEIWT
jgi:hypothetical protein